MVENKKEKIPSENILDEKWDHCLSNLLVKTGIGLGVGIVASALMFRKKSWPIALSTGFGAGVAYAECQRIFNPIALPGVKIIKQSSLSSSSSSPSSPSSSSSSSPSTSISPSLISS